VSFPPERALSLDLLEQYVERAFKFQINLRESINVPEGTCLIVPFLYEFHFYDEIKALGEVVAEGDVVVY